MLNPQKWLKDHPDLQFAILVSKKPMRPQTFRWLGHVHFVTETLVAVTEVFLEETGGAPVSYGNLKHSAMTVFV
jgi:hypothetical protein